MAALDFRDLAQQFCAAVGTPTPEISPNHEGILAFTARLRDVDVTVTHDPIGKPGHAFVLVVFGPLPEGRELQAARQLLRSNLLMLQAQSPVFSLNPIDDQVLLQYAYPLAEASGSGLLSGLVIVVDTAVQWRKGFFLDLETTSATAIPARASEDFA